MGCAADWDPIVSRLEEDYRCVCVELPGHGHAGIAAELTWDRVSEQIESELDLQAEGSPVLIGYSMGGRIALQLAVRRPDAYRGLVLIAASPGISSDAEREARAAWVAGWVAALESDPIEQVLQRWYAQDVFASLQKRADLLEVILERRRENRPEALVQVLAALDVSRQQDLGPELNELPLDVLAIAGAEDAKYCRLVEALAEDCPAVRHVIVPGAGHCVHLEQPEKLLEVLQGYLSRNAGESGVDGARSI